MNEPWPLPDKALVSVDIVLFTIQDAELRVLLIRRLIEPFAGEFALPGGFVLADESLDEAAARELQEETGFKARYLEQLRSYGDPARDPRGRVVTVAYYALTSADQTLQAGTDAQEAHWLPVSGIPKLAFDHNQILEDAHQRLKERLDHSNVGFDLLPKQFTLSDLQGVHEAILGHHLDKRNFVRRMEMKNLLVETDQKRATGRKPARLYTFAG